MQLAILLRVRLNLLKVKLRETYKKTEFIPECDPVSLKMLFSSNKNQLYKYSFLSLFPIKYTQERVRVKVIDVVEGTVWGQSNQGGTS